MKKIEGYDYEWQWPSIPVLCAEIAELLRILDELYPPEPPAPTFTSDKIEWPKWKYMPVYYEMPSCSAYCITCAA